MTDVGSIGQGSPSSVRAKSEAVSSPGQGRSRQTTPAQPQVDLLLDLQVRSPCDKDSDC